MACDIVVVMMLVILDVSRFRAASVGERWHGGARDSHTVLSFRAASVGERSHGGAKDGHKVLSLRIV